MKRMITLLAAIALTAVAAPAWSETLVGPEIKSEIARILDNPAKVYNLDAEAGRKNMERIDEWLSRYLKLSESNRVPVRKEGLAVYKIQASKNAPIASGISEIKGVEHTGKFNIMYSKSPNRRGFVKELEVPTKESLPAKAVVELGSDFIIRNNFIRVTDKDVPGEPMVSSRKRKPFGPEGKDQEALTLNQRVEFRRKFMGYDVVNSKQVVGVHPASREILSYKSIDWTPVDEASGRDMPYISADGVLSEINSAYGRSKAVYRVTKVEPGMYQTDKIIFPVLTVHVEQVADNEKEIPEERALVICLVKGLDMEKKKKDLAYPGKAD